MIRLHALRVSARPEPNRITIAHQPQSLKTGSKERRAASITALNLSKLIASRKNEKLENFMKYMDAFKYRVL